jgi:hypothetical protein
MKGVLSIAPCAGNLLCDHIKCESFFDAEIKCRETMTQWPTKTPTKEIFCPNCGVKGRDSSRFCTRCGTAMGASLKRGEEEERAHSNSGTITAVCPTCSARASAHFHIISFVIS